jgi:hypothetical protein
MLILGREEVSSRAHTLLFAPITAGTPRNAPSEAAPAHVLRDRLVLGPSLPKPPPFPAGNKCFRQPGKSGYLGGSQLKALSSDAGESDQRLRVW